MSLDFLLLGVLVAIGGALAFFMLRRRAKREALDTQTLAKLQQNAPEPLTLHPVVDLDRCIGSLSCTAVCPEGDILGVVDGKAALINPSACIGHGKCEVECPVNAISLVFGSARRGVDLPETNEFFESSRPGVHIVGEVAGMGLIKNAIAQGLQVARHLGPLLIGSQAADRDDVVVVGAGPSGLATALGLQEQKLNFAVLEQGTLGGTIAHYPRQKVVMTEKVDLPFFGKFGAPLISKEQLLESWEKAISCAQISINTGTRVEKIDGTDGDFTVHTSKGPVRARKVVLAIGRRGSPRMMAVPGEDLPKVSYRLIDAQQYDGARVLVVGGGDSALEAAIQIADQSDAEVTLSCRQPEFGKAREANKRRLEQLAEAGRIYVLMSSRVTQVFEGSVMLDDKGAPLALPNDFVIACLGGEVPTEFLSKLGVEMTTLRGESMAPRARRGSAKQALTEKEHRRLSFALFVLGALIVATLFVVGQDYYRLSQAERLTHAAHKFLKPSGPWGHGVGIVATLVMMSNFFYGVRKRWKWLKGASTIRTWLTFHQFVGFLSPVVIVFHAAFQSNNYLATLTAAALSVVVLTGVLGRFIYGLVPGGEGNAGELKELSTRWRQLSERLGHTASTLPEPQALNALLATAVTPSPETSLAQYLAHLPQQRFNDARDLSQARKLFPSAWEATEFTGSFKALRKLQGQVSFFRSLKVLMTGWRVFHVVLAILLVLLIAAHIGVSLFLGYRWILT